MRSGLRFGRRGRSRVTALKTDGCLGMALIKISNTWRGEWGGGVGAVVQESECAQRRIASAMTLEMRWRVGRRCRRQTPSAKSSSATRELRGIGQPVRKDLPRGAAISPDSCRGWSRQRMARIRAQREPIISPAGTGAVYCGPEGSASVATSVVAAEGDPSWCASTVRFGSRGSDVIEEGSFRERSTGEGAL